MSYWGCIHEKKNPLNYGWKHSQPPSKKGFYMGKERSHLLCVVFSSQVLYKVEAFEVAVFAYQKWPGVGHILYRSNSFHSNNTEIENLAIPLMFLEKVHTIREFFVLQKCDSDAVCQCQALCPSVNKNLTCCAEVPNPLSIKRESNGSVL